MLESLIQYLRLFRDIPPGDIAMIQQELSYREVAEGTLLAREGNTCRELFFIIQGVLKIMVNNDKGDEVAHFFLKENQFCTILYSFNDQVPARESIYAACDATLAVFSRDRLLRLYEKLPYLQTLINQITQQALLEKIRIRAAYHVPPVRQFLTGKTGRRSKRPGPRLSLPDAECLQYRASNHNRWRCRISLIKIYTFPIKGSLKPSLPVSTLPAKRCSNCSAPLALILKSYHPKLD